MWDIVLQNLPTIIIVAIAAIICGAELIKAIRVWKEEHQKKIDKKKEEENKEASVQETLKQILSMLGSVNQKLVELEQRVGNAETQLQCLTESDMHDIKAWIVVQYHKFYVEQGWIDNYSAETIERRYSDYQREGGNSYIEVLIERLRTLPMDPPSA